MEQDSLPPPFSSATDAPPPSHPSYAEMITAAILWDSSQGKQGGSSRRAIAKYIDRVYTDLPPSHSSLLTQYLKELKNSGHLTMVKNSYQLASAYASAAANPELPHTGSPPTPTQKRAGRPPKPKPDQAQPNSAQDNGVQTGKKRGRPPKQQVIRPHQVEHQIIMEPAEVPFVQPISQAEPIFGDGLEAQKRRPGRPPKLTPVVPFASLAQQTNPVDSPVQETVEGKRRPGRPSKNNVGGPVLPVAGTGRSRGRPKKSGLGPVSRPVGKKPRGRPPKMSGGVMVTGKRRGRPPKGSGPPKPRKLSGKRLGRPKKDAANFRQASGQIVNEELTRKLDLIQSKIRDAVDVIRPYIPHENTPLMALQQLEELVTPNVTAPQTAPLVMATPMTVIAPVPVSAAANITAPPTGTVTAPPTETVTAPFMNMPGPFSVNLPPMTVGAPFQVPSSFDNQQRMSWMPPSEAQS